MLSPHLLDLFGEIPVLQSDVDTWIDVVPQIPRTSWRRDHYARSWNVPEKIRQAKRAGRWPEIEKARRDQLAGLGCCGCLTSSLWP